MGIVNAVRMGGVEFDGTNGKSQIESATVGQNIEFGMRVWFSYNDSNDILDMPVIVIWRNDGTKYYGGLNNDNRVILVATGVEELSNFHGFVRWF